MRRLSAVARARSQPEYMVRQRDRRAAAGLNVISTSGWMEWGRRRRSSARDLKGRVRGSVLPSIAPLRARLPFHGGRRDRLRRRVPRQVEAGDDAGLRVRRGGCGRILHVHRVEHAVTRIVGIEEEVDETGGEIAFERQSLKQAGPSAEAVEIEVGRERFLLLVGCNGRCVITRIGAAQARPA